MTRPKNGDQKLKIENLEDRVTPAVIPFAQTDLVTNADGAQDVFAADVDSDGDTDLISASRNDDTVAWYRNNGFGSFTKVTIDSTVDGAGAVSAFDFEGDGDTDILASAFVGDQTYLFRNDGSENFTRVTIAPDVDLPKDIIGVDLEGDGDADVLTAVTLDGQLRFDVNNGAGGFVSTPGAAAFANVDSVAAADVNGDGTVDLLGSSSDGVLRVYPNNGNPNIFNAFPSFVTVDDTRSTYSKIDTADVDGDGDADILASSGGLEDKVFLYRNDGGLSFTRTEIASDIDAQSVRAADLDRDGDIDAVVASRGDDTVYWLENVGGSFVTRTITTNADAAQSAIAADLDRDGDIDVASASEFDDTISFYRNNTIHRSAAFPDGQDLNVSVQSPRAVTQVDLDRDGDIDLLAASNPDDTVAWYENDGNGNYTERTVSKAATQANDVKAADIDGDGDIDVVAALSNRVVYYENDGNQNFSEQFVGAAQLPLSIDVGDWDGDGDLDVIAATLLGIPSAGGQGVVQFDNRLNEASNDFKSAGLLGFTAGVQSVVNADIDGDGNLDAVFSRGGGNVNAILGTGQFGITGKFVTVDNKAGEVRGLAVGDADQDGDIDVFAASFSNDAVYFYANDGGANFTRQTAIANIDGATSVAVADADLDGDLDVAAVGFNDDSLYYAQFSAPSYFQEQISKSLDQPFDVAFADTDGDGDADIVTGVGNAAGASTARIVVFDNQGGQAALPTTDVAPTSIAPGDKAPVLRFDLIHNGRPGDSDAELASLDLRFADGNGTPLSSSQANVLIENVYVYLDTNGNGSFDASDTAVATVGNLSLSGGVQTVTFTDGDPNVTVDAPGGTFQKTYLVVVELTGTAAAQTPNTFTVTHLTESTSLVEDAATDLPLSLEFEANTTTNPILADAGAMPEVVSVTSPTDDDLYGIGQTIDVVLTFSEPVTLTGGNLLITLDTGATVTVAPFASATAVSGTYTIAAGEESPDLDSVSVALETGATLRDAMGNDATLTVPNGSTLADNSDIVVDGVAPNPPSVAIFADDTGTPGDGLTSDTTLLIGGTAEPNAVVEVFRDGVSLGTTIANNDGDWTFMDPDTLSDGSFQYTATAADAAGNVSALSAPLEVTVDTQLLEVLVESVTEDSGRSNIDGVTNDDEIAIIGFSTLPNASVEVFRDGVSIGTTTSGPGGNWSIIDTDELDDGTYQYTAIASTASRTSPESAPFTVVIDTETPDEPEITGVGNDSGMPGDAITDDNTLVINGTAEPDAFIEVFLDGDSIGTTFADADGNWSFDYTGTVLSDGEYAFTARQTDVAGNTSDESDEFEVVIDTTGRPMIALVSEDTGRSDTDAITSDTTLTLMGSAQPNESVEIFRDGISMGTVTSDDNGMWVYTDSETLAEGTYVYTARANDAMGMLATSPEFTVVVDLTAPVVTVDALRTDSDSPELAGTVDDTEAEIMVMVNGQTYTATNNGDGTWTLPAGMISPSLIEGTYDIEVTATDLAGNAGMDDSDDELSITDVVTPPGGGVNQNAVGQFAVGAGPGGGGTVTVYNADGSVAYTVNAFPDDSVPGGVRTAVADVNGDGTPDLIVAAGPGGAPQVKVFDGVTRQEIRTINAFEPSFLGGVYISAGDLNGDGAADIVVSPDEGGGPRVRIFSGADGSQIADFFGIDDPNFRGGARTALADVDGDGQLDLIVAAGFGGGPRIATFDGASVASGSTSPFKPFGDFFAFEQTLRNGVFIGGGDVDGDGLSEVIAGGGPGGGPRVLILSGAELMNGNALAEVQNPVGNFFAGDINNRGGIRVVAKDLDSDSRSEVVVGAGENGGSRVTAYDGSTVTSQGTPSTLLDFSAIGGFGNGIFVG